MLHGYGIALWRLRRFKEAEEIFRRMLMLNPPDNQGVRFLIDRVVKKEPWRRRYGLMGSIPEPRGETSEVPTVSY